VYDKYYQFEGAPFLLTPDSRFFFGSSGHARAIAHLVYGLAQREGFIVITGEVGAGKTTLVEQAWSHLDHTTYVLARVVTTQVSGDDLLRLVTANFGLSDPPGTDKATLLRRFEQFVHEQLVAGRRCVLVVDEVQNLSTVALEELRMLSNITVDGRASVQTILLGQPQFRQTLAGRDLEQLRQRVLASYHLGPLTEAETRGYIEHRLKTVGWTNDPSWPDATIAAIFRLTGGIPRRINTLCSRVLLYGALEESHEITADMVEITARELNHDLGVDLPPASVVPSPADRDVGADDRVALSRRIDALEAAAVKQEQMLRQVLELLRGRKKA
jgi:putative secretion ATPase (PEP-CTERM system associated)